MEPETLVTIGCVAILGLVGGWWYWQYRWTTAAPWEGMADRMNLTLMPYDRGVRIEGISEGRRIEGRFEKRLERKHKRKRRGEDSVDPDEVYYTILEVELTADCWDGLVVSGGTGLESGLSEPGQDLTKLERNCQVGVDIDERARSALEDPDVTERLLALAERWEEFNCEDGWIDVEQKDRVAPDDVERGLRELIEIAELLDEAVRR